MTERAQPEEDTSDSDTGSGTDDTSNVSASREQAIATAENYLGYQAFSKSGLVEQLTYEQFSAADAKYAVNHITVDWSEQAVKSAKNYLDGQSFSQAGLADQLEYDGFTHAQAEHGASEAFSDR